MTPRPPLVDRNAYGEAFFVRPQRPEDHSEFEWLLPQLTPLFVYLDGNLRGWVRWSMPKAVAFDLGWGETPQCACCDATATEGIDGGLHVDTALEETDWFFDAPPEPEKKNPLFKS